MGTNSHFLLGLAAEREARTTFLMSAFTDANSFRVVTFFSNFFRLSFFAIMEAPNESN